jgi:hypothetical protein
MIVAVIVASLSKTRRPMQVVGMALRASDHLQLDTYVRLSARIPRYQPQLDLRDDA